MRLNDQKDFYPLSSSQERFWFLNQLNPGNPAYHERGAVQITGLLDVALLEQSIVEVMKRHETLRTHFAIVDGQLSQVISPPFSLKLPVVDLRNLDPQAREKEARRLGIEFIQQPFDLSQGQLCRVCLLRLGEVEHLLILNMHHIVSDGDWSNGLFFREMATIYEAFSSGQAPLLPELPLQYKQFTLWQQKQVTDEVLDAQLAYWKQQLAGINTLQLPVDRPRTAVQSYSGAYEEVILPKSLSEDLKLLGQQEGVSLFVTCLAGFKTLLYHYTRQEDICVGSPISGFGVRGSGFGIRSSGFETKGFETKESRIPNLQSLIENQKSPFLRKDYTLASTFNESIPTDYTKSAFSISTDNLLVRLFGATCLAILLVGWALWFFLANLSFYEASKSATINTKGVIVAQFEAKAIKRLKQGQSALFQPNNATNTLTSIQLRIAKIDTKNNKVDLWPVDSNSLKNQKERTGKVKVEVEQVTPATLVLRAAGLIKK